MSLDLYQKQVDVAEARGSHNDSRGSKGGKHSSSPSASEDELGNATLLKDLESEEAGTRKDVEGSWNMFHLFRVPPRLLFVFLGILYTSCDLAYTIAASFLPEKAKLLDTSETEVGIIFAAYAGASLIVSLTAGEITRKIGSRYVILIGTLIEIVSVGAMAMTDTLRGATFTVTMVILRCLSGAGSAFYMVAALTILAGEFPNNFGSIVGGFESFGSVGVLIGPLIGGFLYNADNISAVFEYHPPCNESDLNCTSPFIEGAYGAPFIFSAVFEFVVAAIVLIALPRRHWAPSSSGDKDTSNEIGTLELLRNPHTGLLCICLTISFNCIVYYDPILQLYAYNEYNLSPAIVGMLFFGMVLVYAIACPLAGRVADRLSKLKIHVIGVAIAIVGQLLIGPIPFLPDAMRESLSSLPVFFTGLIVYSIGSAVAFVPLIPEIIHVGKWMRPEGEGDASNASSAIVSACFSVGAIIAPVVSSSVEGAAGFGWASMAGVFMLLFCLLLITVLCLFKVIPWDFDKFMSSDAEKRADGEVDGAGEDEELQER